MPARLFKDPAFDDWARDEGLTDTLLRAAAAEIEAGLVDARIGGGLLKKRLAAPGRGKRGGYRTIVAYRQGVRLVFLHGFAKNEKDNITPKERKVLIKLGDAYLQHDDATMVAMAKRRLIIEVAG